MRLSDADLSMPSGRSSHRHLTRDLQNSYQLGSKDFIAVYQLAKVRRKLAEQPLCRTLDKPFSMHRLRVFPPNGAGPLGLSNQHFCGSEGISQAKFHN